MCDCNGFCFVEFLACAALQLPPGHPPNALAPRRPVVAREHRCVL
jgi:hypothetical protein